MPLHVGHVGHEKMKSLACLACWCPIINSDITNYVQDCVDCKKRKMSQWPEIFITELMDFFNM